MPPGPARCPGDFSLCHAGTASPLSKLPVRVRWNFNGTLYGYGWSVTHEPVLPGGSRWANHAFIMSPIAVVSAGTGMGGSAPMDAYQLDQKIDDGLPRDGHVRAWTACTPLPLTCLVHEGPGGASSANCVRSDVSPPAYNVAYAGTTWGGLCSVAVKSTF